MVRRHNKRIYSHHKKEVIRPTYEKISVEIFSYEHKYSKQYAACYIDLNGQNHTIEYLRSHRGYASKDKQSSFVVEMDYNVQEEGEYRIDIVYENKNAEDYIGEYDLSLISAMPTNLYSNASIISSYISDLNKLNDKLKSVQEVDEKNKIEQEINVYQEKLNATHRIAGEEIKFDGELNVTKRKTIFKSLSELGQYRLTIELPVNCLFVGAVIRKIKKYTGDNLDSVGTNLSFTESTITKSGQVKPMEASFEIAYDNSFECDLTRTGLYFDYADEVNIYVKENAEYSNNEMIRRFGGYISTISVDNDRKKLTINCADRLRDGEAKYILDSLVLLDGTTSMDDMAYYNPLSFNSYGQVLKYLCDIYEQTLKSNISNNYLVAGEKYSTGLSLKFGTNQDIKTISTNNSQATSQANFITIRNNNSGVSEQVWNVYNCKDYSQVPIDITNHLTFHMTYGLGDPKTEEKYETSSSEGGEGVGGKWSKCGVSEDGKYIMAIGKPSAAKDSKRGFTKAVFKRKCPWCGSDKLYWGYMWTGRFPCTTRFNNGSAGRYEGHIYCDGCDADYSVQGWEHINGSSKRLTLVGEVQASSEAEAYKLSSGEMTGGGGTSMSSDEALASVAKKLTKYRYQLGSSSTYADMKRSGSGDCWAFSDAIFTELKALNISCKIFQYVTSYANNHRSVVYLNANKQWVDFPYKKLGFDRMLQPTSNRPNPSSEGIRNFHGGTSGEASSDSSSTETTTVTITRGYDKDKPPQFYIELTYTNEQSWNAYQKKVNLNFTQKAGTDDDISGLTNYWINNALRQTSVNLKNWFADNEHGKNIYLISIRFVAPKLAQNYDNDVAKEVNWYTFDDSTQDFSSCKLDLYQIIFDDAMALNPTDLQSCGKTIGSMMESIISQSGYRATIMYGEHRKDDIINFSVDNQIKPRYTLTEGDESNILEWSNITCSPISSLRNNSICVFKNNKGKYQYAETSDTGCILWYGEQITLQTVSEEIGSKEAYYNARSSKEFNPEFDYTYSAVTPYAPNLQLGDLIEVIGDYKYLNDIKPLNSIQIKYSNDKKPSIQTTLGVGELEPYLRIKQEVENIRTQTKKKSTHFSSSAQPVLDADIYIWDR